MCIRDSYMALIGYIHYEAPDEEQNFGTMLEMLNSMEVREDDEEFKNPVDLSLIHICQSVWRRPLLSCWNSGRSAESAKLNANLLYMQIINYIFP